VKADKTLRLQANFAADTAISAPVFAHLADARHCGYRLGDQVTNPVIPDGLKLSRGEP
jgi:hypothetical protein